ncbi:MAG: DUF4434 domain-containing protein [Oscillospiraceae bacterium]
MKLKGSFVQSWFCCNFDNERWNDEFNQMKALGMDTLILADIFGQTKEGLWQGYFQYQSDQIQFDVLNDTVLTNAFEAAKRNDIKIFLGTGSYDLWWGFKPQTKKIEEFYKTACDLIEHLNTTICNEYKENFAGWYFVPEIANSPTIKGNKNVLNSMNILIDKLNVISPDKPLMLSPYFTKYFASSLKKMEKQWVKILSNVNFRKFDILCPQDAIGSGWINFEDFDKVMQMYKRAIKKSNREILFWINCENFSQPHKGVLFFPKKTHITNFIPAPINRFAKQIKMSEKYTDTIITFSFNHYYSKNNTNINFYNAILHYIQNGVIQKSGLNLLESTKNYNDKNNITTLHIVDDENKFVNCTIYCNGKFVKRFDCNLVKNAVMEKDFSINKNGRIFIECEDAFGNVYSNTIK